MIKIFFYQNLVTRAEATRAIFALFLLFCCTVTYSANRYLVAGGNGNWNSTTNWSSTSGGTSGASYPVAGDAVNIDTNSSNANIRVNVTSACSSFSVYSNYTGTITLDSNLTTSSTVNLGANTTFSGNGTWIMGNTCSIYSYGRSFPNLYLGGGSKTYSLADTLRVVGTLTFASGITLNSTSGVIVCGQLKCNSIIALSANIIAGSTIVESSSSITSSNSSSLYSSGLTLNASFSPTAAIRLTGGTLSGTGTLHSPYGTPLYFQGNCTVSGVINCGYVTINHSSGTIVTSGSTLVGTGVLIFNCPGVTWDTVKLGGYNQYYYLSGNLNVGGKLIFNGVSNTIFSGAYDITCNAVQFAGIIVTLSGNLNVTGETLVSAASFLNGPYPLYTGSYIGNASLGGNIPKIVFNGKGTWSGTGVMANSRVVEINTTDTLRISGTINFSTGTVQYVAGTVIATGSTLACTSVMVLNTAGMYWDNITLYAYNFNHYLYSNLNLTGTLRLDFIANTGFVGAYNINAGNLYLSSQAGIAIPGGLAVSGLTTVGSNVALNGSFTLYTGGLTSYGPLSGTFAGIVFNSKGTWSGSTNITKPVTINTTDTLIISGSVATTGSFTRTAGTVSASGSTFSRSGTFDPSGITWGNITITGTTTLTADCNMTGTLTVTAGSLNGAYTYNVGGGFMHTGAYALGGTSSIVMNGKGTIAVTNPAGSVSLPFTINTTDSITLGTNFRISGCAFTYTSGKIVSGGSTFETSGTASTININNTGFRVGTYLSSISQGFSGSEGFSMGTFSCPTAGRTFTFKAGKTYTIENEVSVVGTAASHCLWKSDTPGTKAIVTVLQGASEDLGFCDATDIDSSLGKTVLTYKGSRSGSLNWNLVPVAPKTAAFTFN